MKKALLVALLVALASVAFWISQQSDDDPVKAPVETAPSASPTVVAPPERVERTPAKLATDLKAADPKTRRSAVREAGRTEDVQALLAATRDEDAGVARTAVGVLNKLYGGGKVAPSQMIALASDRSLDERTRGLVIQGVGAIKHVDSAAMLVRMLAGGNELERRAAATLLARQDPEIAVPALITALSDPDEMVRTAAVESLTTLSNGNAFGTDAGAWRAWWQARR